VNIDSCVHQTSFEFVWDFISWSAKLYTKYETSYDRILITVLKKFGKTRRAFFCGCKVPVWGYRSPGSLQHFWSIKAKTCNFMMLMPWQGSVDSSKKFSSVGPGFTRTIPESQSLGSERSLACVLPSPCKTNKWISTNRIKNSWLPGRVTRCVGVEKILT